MRSSTSYWLRWATLFLVLGCSDGRPGCTQGASSGSDPTPVSIQPRSANAASGPATTSHEMPIVSANPEAVRLYRAALHLRDHGRRAEASALAKQALEHDPKFPQAKAMASVMTPGPTGVAMLEQAIADAASFPEPVRLELDAALQFRNRETATAIQRYVRICELVPGDWRVFDQLATLLVAEERFEEAAAAIQRAIEINPTAGPA